MKELTELERNAIYVNTAYANSGKLNFFQRGIIRDFGTELVLETEWRKFAVKKFFGKLYVV